MYYQLLCQNCFSNSLIPEPKKKSDNQRNHFSLNRIFKVNK
jgi:hypothetical protein